MKSTIILCSPTSEDFRNAINEPQGIYNKGCFFPPLGLLMVAQALKNAGYEVKFYDGNYDIINYKKDILNYVSCNRERILYVGFYVALLQIKDCVDIIKTLKSAGLKAPIIMGGPFTSAFSGIVMKSNIIDICCVGDGARAAVDIADRLANNKDLYNIPGISFIDGDKVVSNPKGQRDSLNKNSNIFYENFIDIELYVNKFLVYLTRAYDTSINRAMPILTGLGCSYKCAFCENALLNHNHISLSAEDIVEHVSYYNKKFNIDSFAFFDEDFFIDKARLFKFLQLLNKEGLKIKWGTQCRVNYFHEGYLNNRVLKDMEKTGCVRLSMGVESGSPRMLKRIKKGIDPENAILAAEYGMDSAIYFSYSFIINLPGESRRDLLMSFNLMDRLVSIKKNSFVSAIHHYFAYPGTPLSNELENKLNYKISDTFTFEQFQDLSLEEYSNLINPQKEDMSRKCIVYYHHRLKIPFQFKLNIRSIYSDFLRVIGIVRKKLNFYRLPLEIYLINCVRSIRKD